MIGKEFAGWMDDAGMSLEAATKHFGVSEQTIYNWRSTRGVPDSRVQWVEERMREFIRATGIDNLPDRITLEISPHQFDAWNHAAVAQGKIIRKWAVDALDEAAAADQTLSAPAPYPVQSVPALRVAEEGPGTRAALDAIQRDAAAIKAARLAAKLQPPTPSPPEPPAPAENHNHDAGAK